MEFSDQTIKACLGLTFVVATAFVLTLTTGGETNNAMLTSPPDFVSCLNGLSLNFLLRGNCSFHLLREQFEARMSTRTVSCQENDADMEIMAVLNTVSVHEAEAKFDELCQDGIKDMMQQRRIFDLYRFSNKDSYKAFFDGRSSWIDGGTAAYQVSDPQDYSNSSVTLDDFEGNSDHIQSIYQHVAKRRPMSWPEHLDNFHNCSANTAMCCWIEHNSTRNTTYHRNTDICYVEYSRAPSSSHVESGIGLFGEIQDGAYCHGFAWEDGSIDDLYKGNLLFAGEIAENMNVHGLSKNIPGTSITVLSYN